MDKRVNETAKPDSMPAWKWIGDATATLRSGWLRLGLPAKLLFLTALFVMLAEILIFLPSIASYRISWLNDRLTAANVAVLAAEAVPGRNVPPALRNELLRTALVRAVAIRRGGARRLILPPVSEINIDSHYDLREPPDLTLSQELSVKLSQISDAIAVFFAPDDRTIRVVGLIGPRYDDVIEIVLPEEPLRRAMVRYGLNIVWLSVLISLMTAALVYFAISALLVRPMMRLSRNMQRFSEDPEDASRIITPSGRLDEIGTAERELSQMQRELAQLLIQKNRLAQLGLAVSKISHDLRNMLGNAQLISDRLTAIPDPTVQQFAPKLIASLDRAINFCTDSLKFGRAEEAEPQTRADAAEAARRGSWRRPRPAARRKDRVGARHGGPAPHRCRSRAPFPHSEQPRPQRRAGDRTAGRRRGRRDPRQGMARRAQGVHRGFRQWPGRSGKRTRQHLPRLPGVDAQGRHGPRARDRGGARGRARRPARAARPGEGRDVPDRAAGSGREIGKRIFLGRGCGDVHRLGTRRPRPLHSCASAISSGGLAGPAAADQIRPVSLSPIIGKQMRP